MYTILFIYRFFYNLKFVSPESWNHVLATQTHSKIERRIYPHSHGHPLSQFSGSATV
ncbi:hypothetical protein LINPERPRIM_LOCUS11785 [Linum perenne]